MRIWQKNSKLKGGKYLVVRRDGSMPAWPHFVLGARDPFAPAALRAYADAFDKSETGACADPAYTASIRELAKDFEKYRAAAGDGDPNGAPHRVDNEQVVRAMQGSSETVEVYPAPDEPRDLVGTMGMHWREVRMANEAQDKTAAELDAFLSICDLLRPLSIEARVRILKASAILLGSE